MDNLARIERNYGCYAEYARQREEDEAYEYEQQEKRNAYCKANREKLVAAGNKVTYHEDCIGCKYYEDIGPTSWSAWDIDDMTHGICHKGKPCDIIHERR